MAIVHFANYELFKARMDQEMTSTADSFVRIGYLLKEARDTQVLVGSGYTSMGAWAQAEYGLTESQTSRFIAICERFGAGEDRLLPQYSAIGYTKLSEMLTLPDHIIEALPESVTREQLREVKADYQEEMRTSDIERMIEPQTPESEMIEAFFRGLFAQDAVLFAKAVSCLQLYRAGEQIDTGEADMVMDMIAPSGVAVLSARVSGHGKLMLTINGDEKDPTLLAERSGERFPATWETLRSTLCRLLAAGETAEETWSALYGTAYPLASDKAKEEAKETAEEEEKEKGPEPAAHRNLGEKPFSEEPKTGETDNSEKNEAEKPAAHRNLGEKPFSEEAKGEGGAEVPDQPDPAEALYPTEDDGEEPVGAAGEIEKSIMVLREIIKSLRAGSEAVITPDEEHIRLAVRMLEQLEAYKEISREEA